ncbi:hypothetical protein PHLGIDRAFT_115917 [Phlebiopsis gigantea 11061_1 CR5-6]|uniref:Uncharacterized protein n=1 Tax=Phlebiopsis gigantea (strain 11061_1 CR5-6) TaxID=745531 RepID=A0A0C3S386_PHLG1|nr:hypothetical protein PHLGIDRAFT_115917 [Phlebiopsis gigantea 11061_1 CR5-6]
MLMEPSSGPYDPSRPHSRVSDLEDAFSGRGEPVSVPPHLTPSRPDPNRDLRRQLQGHPIHEPTIPYIPTAPPTHIESEVPHEPTTHHAPTIITTIPSRTPTPVPVPAPAPHVYAEPRPDHPSTAYLGGPDTIYPEESLPAPFSEAPQTAITPSGRSPPHPPITVVPTTRYSGPGDLELADAERERAERFSDLAHQIADQIHTAEDNEDERERTFRVNEDERQRMYLDREARRDEEAVHHREEVLRDVGDRVEERLATLPPVMPSAPSPYPDEPRISMPVPGHYAGPAPAQSIYEDIHMVPAPGETIRPAFSPTLTPVPSIPPSLPPHPEDIDIDTHTLAHTIQSEVAEATSRHAQEILDTIRLEREELAAARADAERLRAELDAERERRMEELNEQTSALREEIAGLRAENEQLKNDLEQERQLRITEDAARRETERAEDRQRGDDLTTQLADVTTIVSETRDELSRKREQADERWTQKEAWHNECTSQMDDMKQMFAGFRDMFEQEQRVRQAEREAEASKPSVESIVEQLRDENAQLRELLQNLSEGWRADTRTQHEDMMNAIRSTAQEQVPFNISSYLDEFSKTLAKEVRQLLTEVNQLVAQKSQLQFEIASLMEFRARYEQGGIFWRPGGMPPMAPQPHAEPVPEPQLPPEPEAAGPAPGAWRPVRRPRNRRRDQVPATQPVAAPPMQPIPAGMPTMAASLDPRVGSWAPWHPPANVSISGLSTPREPSEVLIQPNPSPPGLFGPRSARSSMYQ